MIDPILQVAVSHRSGSCRLTCPIDLTVSVDTTVWTESESAGSVTDRSPVNSRPVESELRSGGTTNPDAGVVCRWQTNRGRPRLVRARPCNSTNICFRRWRSGIHFGTSAWPLGRRDAVEPSVRPRVGPDPSLYPRRTRSVGSSPRGHGGEPKSRHSRRRRSPGPRAGGPSRYRTTVEWYGERVREHYRLDSSAGKVRNP